MAQKKGGKATAASKPKKPAAKKPAAKASAKTASKAADGSGRQTNSGRTGSGRQNTARQGPPQEKGGRKKTLSNEIKGILIIACGIFLAFAFLTSTTGAVGAGLRNVFYGLLGVSSAVSCIFVVLTGFNVFMNHSRGNGTRMLLLAAMILSTSVLAALISKDTAPVPGGFIDQVVSLYQNGVDSHGGGVLGGGICKLLVMLIGVSGTWVVALAAELIFGILLTGISLESLLRRVALALRRSTEKVRQYAQTEVETEMLPQETEDSEKRGGRFLRRQKETPEEPNAAPHRTKFFDGYFSGQETIPDRQAPPPDSSLKEQSPSGETELPRRFELKEDDALFDQILPPEETAELSTKPLPFRLDNMKTGVLSELPETDQDGSVTPVENPEDEDPVFTPPSQAQLEDQLDSATKAALEAGMPLDRAVTAGKRMAAESGTEEENPIEEQITAAAAERNRITTYYMPTLDLLDPPKPRTRTRQEIRYELEEKANRLLETLHSFKVEATIINITQGPSVTRFELQPGFGVKVSKITGLTDDIALSLAAPGVRIEAPIPGKSAIGIEIPNKDPSPVPIREVLESDKFQNFPSKTAFALGKDIAGSCVVADIARFPHMLIAGQTGSGKSVCINSLILSILFKARPDEVKLIMVDPKMVELGVYNGIPHLLIPVVTDPRHAAGALNWAVGEMQNRYSLLKDNNVRNLKGYNALMEEKGEPESKLPEIVIIIDEFADLMMAARSEVEDAINRLAALARAAGMYLIIATQRPTVNVITGVIKANIPSRIAFNVASQIDSRTILDGPGADKLLGRGDMLYSPSGSMKPQRIQGNFVSDHEIERVVEFVKGQYEADYDEEIMENIQKEQEKVNASLDGADTGDDQPMTRGGSDTKDELFFQAVEMVLDNGQASVAMFQRRFKIGYQRAARLIDQMEERRIIGPYEGTKPRQVLITRQEFLEMQMNEGR